MEPAILIGIVSALVAIVALSRTVNKDGVQNAIAQEKRFARIEADIHDIKVGMGICRRVTDCPILKANEEKPP